MLGHRTPPLLVPPSTRSGWRVGEERGRAVRPAAWARTKGSRMMQQTVPDSTLGEKSGHRQSVIVGDGVGQPTIEWTAPQTALLSI